MRTESSLFMTLTAGQIKKLRQLCEKLSPSESPEQDQDKWREPNITSNLLYRMEQG